MKSLTPLALLFLVAAPFALAQQAAIPGSAGDYTVSGTIKSYTVNGTGSATGYSMDTNGNGVADKEINVACQPNSLAGTLRAMKASGANVTFTDVNGDDGDHNCNDTLTEN